MQNLENINQLVSTAVEAIQDKKGKGISVLNMENVDSAPAFKFIICEGRSTSQVAAIADSIREEVREKLGIKPYNYDGYRNAQWIVIDYGELFVHVFLPDARKFYNLEDLWSDADTTEIPDLD